ncbi:MAG: ImmA/IrrE family metallo-endopeptidase [Ruminococcus sp.]
MNAYEQLLSSSGENIIVVEKNFKSQAKGLCKGNKIGISKAISTSTEKACILAEELGHHYTTVGNILGQSSVSNRKQELRARMWAYNKLIGLIGIIKSYEHGCQSYHEMAEYLDVTEEFLRDALKRYHQKYGVCTTVDNYIIYFEPLGVVKMN